MKSKLNILFITLLFCIFSQYTYSSISVLNTALSQEDEHELLVNWSLFHEDYRNGYYERAIPYGWVVMEMNPTRFTSLYRNLAECYRQLYLEEDDPDKKEAYADSIIIVYQKGIEYIPDRAESYYLQKAYYYENYYSPPKVEESIHAYEQALNLGFETIEFDYIDQLGNLYIRHRDAENDYEDRAIQLYQRYLRERDPDNQTAMERLQRLIRDPAELVKLAEERLRTDPENPASIWNLVQAYITAQQYQKAIPHVEKLIEMNPESVTYWRELARLYDRVNQLNNAIKAYQRLLELNPDDRELPLDIGRAHRQLGNYRQARTFARQAQRMDTNWGEPLIEIAAIYEEVIERCVVENKGGWENMELADRIMYKLVQEYYQQAARADSRVAERARERAQFLNDLVPRDDDYFFNRELIENGTIEVFGDCYEWIDESITVPERFR